MNVVSAPNPILSAVAREASANDYALSGITFSAPLVSGEAVLSINWAHFSTADDPDIDLPQDVGVTAMSRVPYTHMHMPQLTDPEGMVLAAAWQHGAWDVARTCIGPGYAGTLPPPAKCLGAAAREQGWVSWYWRPMLRGPEIRAKANAHRDATLDRWTLGRNDAAPDIRTPRLTPGQQHILRLGRGDRTIATTSKTYRATAMQRGYLGRLLRKAGLDPALPDDLSKTAASAWIDRLRGTDPDAPAQEPTRRSRPCTVNQWRMIDSLMRRLGRREHVPIRMTYDEAAAWIEKLKNDL